MADLRLFRIVCRFLLFLLFLAFFPVLVLLLLLVTGFISETLPLFVPIAATTVSDSVPSASWAAWLLKSPEERVGSQDVCETDTGAYGSVG